MANCQHCREYILDQGPDLSDRLARISRRASDGKSDHAPLIVHAIETQFVRFDSSVARLEYGGQSLFLILCWPLIQCANLSLYITKALLNTFGWMMLGMTLYDPNRGSPAWENRVTVENPVISAEDRPRTHLALAHRLARVRHHLANVQEHQPEADFSPLADFAEDRRTTRSIFGVLLRLADDIPGWLWLVFLWFVVLILWLAILALR